MRMIGKTALITGATSGTGFYTAAELARRGARVFVTGRDETRGLEAIAELRRLAGHDEVEFIGADASSVEDNVTLAEELSRRITSLDILINNAGGVFAERGETDEGFERSLALNFIGPVILTQHLLRLLGRSRSGGRIVNVVSSAFRLWKGNPFDDPQSRRRYVGIEVYGRAKLLNLLFTLALSQDLREAGISVNAVTPVPPPLARWFERRPTPSKAADAVAALAMGADSILTGWYVEGRAEKRLPRHLLGDAIQNRAWELGDTLAARPLQALSGVAMNQRFPKGSASVAWRSPYGLSSGAVTDVAPARSASL